jgi:hypothetical protein
MSNKDFLGLSILNPEKMANMHKIHDILLNISGTTPVFDSVEELKSYLQQYGEHGFSDRELKIFWENLLTADQRVEKFGNEYFDPNVPYELSKKEKKELDWHYRRFKKQWGEAEAKIEIEKVKSDMLARGQTKKDDRIAFFNRNTKHFKDINREPEPVDV